MRKHVEDAVCMARNGARLVTVKGSVLLAMDDEVEALRATVKEQRKTLALIPRIRRRIGKIADLSSDAWGMF